MNIYAMDIPTLSVCSLVAMLTWGALWWALGGRRGWRAALLALSGALSVVAVCGVLSHTVLGRVPDGEHRFVLVNGVTNEFGREMFMNALLYLPLGLALSPLAGPWTMAIGFLMSLGIEAWQYLVCTGLAQGTDVVCNTLGCAVGSLPVLVVRAVRRSGRGRPRA